MKIIKGKYDFKKDVITGERGEDIVKNFMIQKGYAFIEKNYDYRYDLKMSFKSCIKTYEIKTDIYPINTGNIVVEFECRGKSSGIAVTEADYFTTYFLHFNEIWNIETHKLKCMIDYLKPKIFNLAGDKGSMTKLYSFKKTEVAEFFKIHNL